MIYTCVWREREIDYICNVSVFYIWHLDKVPFQLGGWQVPNLQGCSLKARSRYKSRKSPCPGLKAGKFSCSNGGRQSQPFSLFGPSPDWIRPTLLVEGQWAYSRYWYKCQLWPKVPSQKHPEECLTKFLARKINHHTHGGKKMMPGKGKKN